MFVKLELINAAYWIEICCTEKMKGRFRPV